ncbi:uncharacterized protein [Clytia hemisphaerica]|uniref:uncharacterized protein n=1 Tax=Clytia hemisphaerica TaxID=252671 RepID=UPI0034D58EFC
MKTLLLMVTLALAIVEAQQCHDDFIVKIKKQTRMGRLWKVTAVVTLNLKTKLKDWKLSMEFKDVLQSNFRSRRLQRVSKTKGRNIITLKSKKKTKLTRRKIRIRFIASFMEKQQQETLLSCISLCGVEGRTRINTCNVNNPKPITTNADKTKVAKTLMEKPKHENWCLGNYHNQFVSEWFDNVTYTSVSRIKPNFDYKLHDWKLRMIFHEPLATDMKTWITHGDVGSTGQSEVILTPESWNQVFIPERFLMTYEVKFKHQHKGGYLKCAEFCGVKSETNRNICDPCPTKYDYKEVLEKSLLFYEAQRSGNLPDDNRITWRGDSALNDGQDNNIDLTGGYYDAGDHVKFGFPMAATITNLAWGMLEFKKGYTSSGQYEYGLKAIKWGTDYFIKCHPEPNKFYGQVGDGDMDHKYWGRPEDMTMNRPTYFIDETRPGSELAGETAAALAASLMVFRTTDFNYSEELLRHAEELFSFAMKYRGNYSHSIPKAAPFYKSYSGYNDELALASLWLYRATENPAYKAVFLDVFETEALKQWPGEFSWDNKWYGVQVLAQRLKVSDKNYLFNFHYLLKQTDRRTPKGLFYVQKWGTLRHAANLAFLARVASTMADKDFYNEFTHSQINYMLGDTGRSFIVGFGVNPPQKPHHASSSCPDEGPCGWDQYNSKDPNPQILYGALVGGPDANDNYVDDRTDYVQNEVACDYNAGFQSAIAGLIQLSKERDC